MAAWKLTAALAATALLVAWPTNALHAADEGAPTARQYQGPVKTVETEEALFTKKVKKTMTQTTLEQFDEEGRLTDLLVKLNGLQTRRETYSYGDQNVLLETKRFDENDVLASVVTNDYDDDFRLTGQTVRNGADEVLFEFSFEHDEQGRLSRRIDKNGPTLAHEWNNAGGRLIEIISRLDDKGEAIKARSIERDARGRVAVEIEFDTDGLGTIAKKTTYTYDENNTAVTIIAEDKMQNSVVETEFDPTYDEHGNWIALARQETRSVGDKVRLFETVLTRTITYYEDK